MEQKKLLIAGGGTGGHLFPGMAVAEEFVRRGPDHEVLFVGTGQGIEARLVPAAGYAFKAVRARGIAGMGALGKLRALALIPVGLADAARAIREFKPHAALGVGGYVSGPAILAARIMGVPCAIQEQNAVPGWANRILGTFAWRVFISFEPARAWFGRAESKGRVVLAGNPVRRSIVEALLKTGPARKEEAPGGDRLNLLVLGGSQGARGLNRMTLAALAELDEDRRQRLEVRHQAGAGDREEVEDKYKSLGLPARVEAFIEDMAAAYREAGLVISRAGAGAVAEIALAGRPSILVPYPFAAADHQARNAEVLAAADAAVMLRESEDGGKALAAAIAAIVDDPARAAEMSRRARMAAKPEAAQVIVEHCLGLMGLAGIPDHGSNDILE